MAATTPYKRELPFIHRAWKTAFDRLPYNMGFKLSTGNGDTAITGDQQPRVVKRRRIAEDSPEAALAVPGRLLPKVADDVERALRIEVLSITEDRSGPRPANLHYGNGSPEKKDIPVIKARCRILICEWAPGFCRVLHSDSQLCNFKVFRDSDDVCRTARIYLPTPFQVPVEKVLVERQDGSGFRLGDQYLVRVELESAGDPKWPPMDLLPETPGQEEESGDPRRWILASQAIYNFEKSRLTGNVVIRKKKNDIPLDLVMDMDLRWAACHTASPRRPEEPALPPDARVTQVNAALGSVADGPVTDVDKGTTSEGRTVEAEGNGIAEDEDDHEEATTPSRSLRTRGKQQNYNLKLLSDKARGREGKERKQRKLANMERRGDGVVWDVPTIGEIPLESYSCIRCFATHSSMEQLKAHLNVHVHLRYTIDMAQEYIRILAPDDDGHRPSRSAYHSLPSPEDQESDMDGGDVAPQNRNKPSQVNAIRMRRHRGRNLTAEQSSPPKPRDNRRRVPNIKLPLYDRLSKSLLEPGSLVDPPPVDDTWLVQKHRDIIRDYTDVHPDEKEYIYEYDAFVNRDCVTSEPHLQYVYIRFVREKASWIASSPNRRTEWAKHLCYLKSRNALTEETVREALSIIRQAQSETRPEEPEAPTAASPKPACRKSAAGCPECGQSVRVACLACSNPVCVNPLYHKACARRTATQPIDSRNWRCNECLEERKAPS